MDLIERPALRENGICFSMGVISPERSLYIASLTSSPCSVHAISRSTIIEDDHLDPLNVYNNVSFSMIKIGRQSDLVFRSDNPANDIYAPFTCVYRENASLRRMFTTEVSNAQTKMSRKSI